MKQLEDTHISKAALGQEMTQVWPNITPQRFFAGDESKTSR
jgi:hypothetical protein